MSVSLVGGRASKKRGRNQTYCYDRRGNDFWEEETERKNFGLWYMQQNGWSQGEGLGRQRQGDTNHVKAKVKQNNRGIGSKKSKDN